MTDRHPIPDGRTEINGRAYMADAKGALVPVELIKPQHLLEDGNRPIETAGYF